MMKEITAFLIRAKKATYAGKGPESVPTRPRAHDLSYQEGKLLYYDTYLGGSHFSGEEAVWVDACPIWAMNYSGRVTGENFSSDFLKEALYHVAPEQPFRGPACYEKGDYTYRCSITGMFDWFQGYEEIFYQGHQIYECYFHGGQVI